jgi:hypothetical protein
LRQQAETVLTKIDAKWVYARVDGVEVDGRLLLMELELIEPHLYFELFPPGADAFAQALKAY